MGVHGQRARVRRLQHPDDLGNEGLLFIWTWGDGSDREYTTEPFALHSFSRPGSFEVVLTVVDMEGASSSINVDVGVMWDPRSDLDPDGDALTAGTTGEDALGHASDRD